MAQECWNKINIPFPSAVSSTRIPFTDSMDLLIDCLLADCEKVLTLLCSEVLQTEIRVLYELLYILNNGFRQHKPFRALKQVEQCVNRLKEMKLQAAVEDLKEVCPNKFQREAGAEAGECDVPSQPMLEWLGLKLLGASSLLARTLERCTKAFLGILRALIPMYRRNCELLQKVSQSQPMAYLTDFTLPEDLKDFLCLTYPDLKIEEVTKDLLKGTRGKRKSKFSLLSKLFGETEQQEEIGEGERDLMPILSAGHYEVSSLDLGAAVSQRRTDYSDVSPYGLDIKAMLQQSSKTTKQKSLEQQMKLDSSSKASLCQKRTFLKSLKKTSSFRNMAALLKELMNWCRSCKFYQEHKRLAFLSLKCGRMESLEAEGVRVEKRLKTFKIKVQKALTLQQTFPPKHSCSLPALLRTRWQNKFFMRHFRTLRRRSAVSRKSSGTVKGSLNQRRKCRPLLQSSNEVESGENVTASVEIEKMDSQTSLQEPNIPKDDIDDIFESFGF